jgi:hypothetical protein
LTARYIVVEVQGTYVIYDTLADAILEGNIHSKSSAEQRILDIGQEFYE